MSPTDRLAHIEENAAELEANADRFAVDEPFLSVVLSDAANNLLALVEIAKDMERIAEQQPKTIDWIRANGIIFDGPLGTDPDNWENVAFSIYTDLCEVDSIARAALARLGAL